MTGFDYPSEIVQFAEQMVNHPQFRPMMALLKANAVEELLGTGLGEHDRRELLYRQIKAYDDLDAQFRAISASTQFVEDNNGT